MAGSAASGGSRVLGQIPRGEIVPFGNLFCIYETHEPGEHVKEAVPVYRGTSPTRKLPPPYDPLKIQKYAYGRVLGGCVFS